MSDKKENNSEFINPIDGEKIAQNPGLLPYASNVSSAVINPVDEGKVKSRALRAMQQQTNNQLDQIKQQIELLATQAKAIQDRIEVSSLIYQAKTSFEPIIGEIYYLYEKEDNTYVLSMIAENQWGKSFPYKRFVSSVKLMADHTWELVA
jgi:23S rRNA maturation mini-RNase III